MAATVVQEFFDIDISTVPDSTRPRIKPAFQHGDLTVGELFSSEAR